MTNDLYSEICKKCDELEKKIINAANRFDKLITLLTNFKAGEYLSESLLNYFDIGELDKKIEGINTSRLLLPSTKRNKIIVEQAEWMREAIRSVKEIDEDTKNSMIDNVNKWEKESKRAARNTFDVLLDGVAKGLKHFDTFNERSNAFVLNFLRINADGVKSIQNLANRIVASVSNVFSVLDSINTIREQRLIANHRKELERIGERKNRALKAAQETGSDELAIKEKYTKKMEEAEAAFNAERLRIQYESELQQWKWRKISSVVNGASALLTTMRDNPLWFGLPAWVLAGTKVVAQQAIIRNARPTKGFATGGIVPGVSFTGDRITARLNSGEMVINREQQKALFDFISNGAHRGGGIPATVVVMLDRKEIARSTVELINDGHYQIKMRGLRK